MKRSGLIDYNMYIQLVSEIAYFKYINGSMDTELNWYEAELEAVLVLKEQVKSFVQNNC